MYFELNFETLMPLISELACWFFTGVCFAATLWYTAEVLRSPHWGNREASREPNSEEEALGYREREAGHSGADGKVEEKSGKEEDEEELTDGESEGVTEEEIWCPDEESSAEENMPELEDITADDKTPKEDQKDDTAVDSATTATTKESAENVEGAENGEKPKEGKTTDEEKESEDSRGFEGKEDQEQKTCPEAVKDEAGQEQDDVAASQKVPEKQEEEEKDDNDKQEKEQQAQPPEAVSEDPTVPAKKTDGATKVLKKKKKKKTRSHQPPPSLFSCPFMSSEMMEPTSAETRGSWRRKDRGKPQQLHSGKSKAEQPNSLPAIQNGETETETAQDAASSSSNVLDKDEDVENLKKEIYEEACPHRKVYKEAERSMTAADRETERRIQQEQLAAIFKLMQDNEDKFGVQSYGDVEEQMKLYKT